MQIAALVLSASALLAQAPKALDEPAAEVALASESPAEGMAEVALAFAKAEAAKLGGDYSLKVAQPPRVLRTKPGKVTFEASHMSKVEPLGRFFVVLAIKVDGDRVAMTRVDLEGNWVGTLLRAKGDLPRKTEPGADQVESTHFEGVPPTGFLKELPEGLRLMRPVASGKILTRADFESIPLVQCGDKVRLTATREALTITVDTTARSKAGLGERVRLESPGGRRPVSAIVTGPGEAELR
jgi:flagella basal body P-ring formation protein FlgA